MLAATLFHLHQKIPSKWLDILEIRVDQCEESEEEIRDFMNKQSVSSLLTYRRTQETDETYFSILIKLAGWKPAYLDVEFGTPKNIVKRIQRESPSVKIILSYHAEKPILSLSALYNEMKEIEADYYKIVQFSEKGIDGLRLLAFLKENADGKLAAFCMGEKGQFTRVLSKILQGTLHFCSLENNPPYGQFSLDYLRAIYRFQTLNSKTKIYGLIGSPVEKSVSAITHNEVFKCMKKKACYVKIDLPEEDHQEGLFLLEKLGFKGLSVTMPLKSSFRHKVVFADPIAQQLGVINTLVFSSKICGYNTDAFALEKIINKYDIKGKRVVILGAGSIARVLSHLLHQKGCCLLYWNRSPEKLEYLKKTYNGKIFQKGEDYDVLINTTPVGMDGISCPVEEEYIQERKTVFDVISFPLWTPLLKKARKKRCALIFGIELFKLQAALQFDLWE